MRNLWRAIVVAGLLAGASACGPGGHDVVVDQGAPMTPEEQAMHQTMQRAFEQSPPMPSAPIQPAAPSSQP